MYYHLSSASKDGVSHAAHANIGLRYYYLSKICKFSLWSLHTIISIF